jgi:DNA repair ATPase RecN
MISKLILSNFQAHKKTELEFCPGVNAIIGESDEGKTSIIRALYWAAQNKPSGGDFISDFSKRGECSSTIVVDGNEITRFKNKNKNEYRVNDQPFKALGKSGVPDEVKDILQLDDLNFQNQMDSPFLLSSNGGEVARYLNEVADLEIISESLTKIKSRVDSTNREIKTTEIEVETSKEELSTLDWIEQAEKELLYLEDDNNEFKNKQSLQEHLIHILEECDDLVEKLEQFKDEDQELYDICLLIDEYKNYQAQEIYLNGFKSDLKGLESISDKIDNLPFDEKEIKDIVHLSTLIDSYLIEKQRLLEYNVLFADAYQMEYDLEVYIDCIQTSETEFKAEFPDTCPLCEQEII